MKFQNRYGSEGKVEFGGKRYSFKDGVFECNKDEEDLIKFLKASSAWADYKPTAEDKVKDYSAEIERLKLENKELQNLLDEVVSDKKSDKKIISNK